VAGNAERSRNREILGRSRLIVHSIVSRYSTLAAVDWLQALIAISERTTWSREFKGRSRGRFSGLPLETRIGPSRNPSSLFVASVNRHR